jgi:hypothetical protein
MSTATPTSAAVEAVTTTLRRVPGARRILPSPLTAQAHADPRRWRTVTVLADAEVLRPGASALAGLEALGELVEVRRTPAPADRGTELAVRVRAGRERDAAWAGEDPTAVVRRELRRAKQLAEVGEVLRGRPQPEGVRSSTVSGRLVDRADERAGEEGVL